MSNHSKYDLRRVDTVNLFATWGVVIIFLVLAIASQGFVAGLGDMGKSLAVGVWQQVFIFEIQSVYQIPAVRSYSAYRHDGILPDLRV